jgi:hypothetical protein
MIGQTYALKYPGTFATLVLADTTSRMPRKRCRPGGTGSAPRTKGHAAARQPTLGRWFTEPYR